MAAFLIVFGSTLTVYATLCCFANNYES
jgi:hypothetical protein